MATAATTSPNSAFATTANEDQFLFELVDDLCVIAIGETPAVCLKCVGCDTCGTTGAVGLVDFAE